MAQPALEVRNLNAWHNKALVLRDINLVVDPGQLVCLLGSYEPGRSTVLRSISGLTGERTGSVRINGTESIHLPPGKVKPLGLSYCPEEQHLHNDLSCEENLLFPVDGAAALGGGMSLADIYDIFPVLKSFQHHPAGHLNTAERQLLAIARALRLGANVLLLDAITSIVTSSLASTLSRALGLLKEQHYTIVMATNTPPFTAPLADQYYVVQNGTLHNPELPVNAL